MADDTERTIGSLIEGYKNIKGSTDVILSNMREINREVIETGLKVKSAHKRIDETEKKIESIQPKISKHQSLHDQAKGYERALKKESIKYGLFGGGSVAGIIAILKALGSSLKDIF